MKKIQIECPVCGKQFTAPVPLFGDESGIFVGRHIVDQEECEGSNQIAEVVEDE